MNFFEHQQQARQRSALLVLLFTLAIVAIVVITNLAIISVFYIMASAKTQVPAFGQWLQQHPRIPLWTSLIAIGLIGGASLYRMLTLSQGGGAVARLLGGVRVDPGTRDPARRQLQNVVEEVAIASGMPVPEVYVLETEAGMNAFAAGYSPGDAAIAVTRGLLDSLTRDELQGVVAHEFSHILNGDTRLNMRLISASFGILVIALTGRMLLRAMSRARGSSREGRAVAAGFTLGLVLFVIGYIGVLATRLIKAAVSRRRELLADASAVQFTRNPQGIAGALKKIAVSPMRATLVAAEGEEISHMLIATPTGLFSSLFASHPPILDRIRLLDPRFRPEELEQIRLAPMRPRPAAAIEAGPRAAVEILGLAPHLVIGLIGNPGAPALRSAAVLEQDTAPRPCRTRRAPRTTPCNWCWRWY